MQPHASGMNTLFNFGCSRPSVSVSAGGLSCGSSRTDICLPLICGLTKGAGAGLGICWGTPRRFSWLWCASEAKHSGKVLCIGSHVLFRRLQDIGRVVQPKASRPAPARALAPSNTTARHRASQPLMQQAALAERRAQCTHNPSLNLTRYGRPAWPGWRHSVHFRQPGQAVLPQRSG